MNDRCYTCHTPLIHPSAPCHHIECLMFGITNVEQRNFEARLILPFYTDASPLLAKLHTAILTVKAAKLARSTKGAEIHAASTSE